MEDRAIGALDAARKRYSEEVAERVRAAIDDICAQGKVPSFYSVASRSHVARSTLYRRSDLRRMVDGARTRVVDRQLPECEKPPSKRLDLENERLRSKLKTLTDLYRRTCGERDLLRSRLESLQDTAMRARRASSSTDSYAVVLLPRVLLRERCFGGTELR